MVKACQTHVRESTRFTAETWRMLLNASQMEMQAQTSILRGEFSVPLQPLVREYFTGSLYRILGKPRMSDGTKLTVAGYDDITDFYATGTPSKLYPLGSHSGSMMVGLYPIPAEETTGSLILYGCMWPEEIKIDTPESFIPDFEAIDHDTMVLGAVCQAERIDTDLTVSQMVRQQYADGLLAMKSRANYRATGARKMVVRGR